MRASTLVRLAGRALGRNKMRSFLTTLGVVIGVAAVIAMTAIGEGAKFRVQQTFEAMGTNLLIVLPGSSATGGMQGGFGSQPTLTWDDLRSIQSELSAVPRRGAGDPDRGRHPGRGPELDHLRGRHHARLLPDSQLARRPSGQKFSAEDVSAGAEGGAARSDGGGEALRRRR